MQYITKTSINIYSLPPSSLNSNNPLERILKMQRIILSQIINNRFPTILLSNNRTILSSLILRIKNLLCQKLQDPNIPILRKLRKIIMRPTNILIIFLNKTRFSFLLSLIDQMDVDVDAWGFSLGFLEEGVTVAAI